MAVRVPPSLLGKGAANFVETSAHSASNWCSRSTGQRLNLSDADIEQILNVMSCAWAEGTLETYASGLLSSLVACVLWHKRHSRSTACTCKPSSHCSFPCHLGQSFLQQNHPKLHIQHQSLAHSTQVTMGYEWGWAENHAEGNWKTHPRKFTQEKTAPIYQGGPSKFF